jgi:DNA-binding transcriptional ArsR family regulator
MQVITIESEAFDSILKKLDEIHTKLSKQIPAEEKWLDNQEFIQLLKISKRSAQSYRDSGLISFSQVGNKIYYKLSDVHDMLKTHYHKGFKIRQG